MVRKLDLLYWQTNIELSKHAGYYHVRWVSRPGGSPACCNLSKLAVLSIGPFIASSVVQLFPSSDRRLFQIEQVFFPY
jgi:hypothetical protein